MMQIQNSARHLHHHYYYYLIKFNVRIEPLGYGRLIIVLYMSSKNLLTIRQIKQRSRSTPFRKATQVADLLNQLFIAKFYFSTGNWLVCMIRLS